jgi:hypothetical protein
VATTTGTGKATPDKKDRTREEGTGQQGTREGGSGHAAVADRCRARQGQGPERHGGRPHVRDQEGGRFLPGDRDRGGRQGRGASDTTFGRAYNSVIAHHRARA